MNKACELGLAFKVEENPEKVKVAKEEENEKLSKISNGNSLKLKLLLSLSQMIGENYPLPLEGPMQV